MAANFKNMKKVIKQLESEGWVAERSKHIILRHPEYGTIVASGSPSCQHAYKNVLKAAEKKKNAKLKKIS